MLLFHSDPVNKTLSPQEPSQNALPQVKLELAYGCRQQLLAWKLALCFRGLCDMCIWIVYSLQNIQSKDVQPGLCIFSTRARSRQRCLTNHYP